MNILITGGQGQLGRTLDRELKGENVLAPGHGELDVTDVGAITRCFSEFKPEVVLHCAAITDPEICEKDPELAYAVNDAGCANIAMACRQTDARLIAFSTGSVFDGQAEAPYSEFVRPTRGANCYGQSKWAGECAIRLNCPIHLIVRLSWLYGEGGPSFVHQVLEKANKNPKTLSAEEDLRGNPTSSLAVARFIRDEIRSPSLVGTIHLACEGEASRFEFAREVLRLAGLAASLAPARAKDTGHPELHPANSCLENRRLAMAGKAQMPSWKEALAEFMAEEFPRTSR